MKKVYLTILGLTVIGSSFAQKNYAGQNAAANGKFSNRLVEQKSTSKGVEKAIGNVIWSDDFSTPANWVVNNSGQTDPGFGWDINATADGWYFNSPVNSVSDGNFAEVGNGDPTATPETQAAGVTYTMTTANPIDIATLGGSNNAILSFYQYGARFYDAQEVYISTDNSNWIKVGDNSTVDALTLTGGAAMTNPTIKTCNLSYALNGQNASAVWIRFSWTSEEAPDPDPNVWIAYGWMIDDVSISTLTDNDKVLLEPTMLLGDLELPYTQIPLNQIDTIKFAGRIFNNGTNQQVNSKLDVAILGGATLSSPTQTIPSLDTLDFLTPTFTPAATVATINYTYTAVSDEVEDVPSNNSATGSFKITSSTLAVDNNTLSGTISNVGSEPDGALKIGNLMEVMHDGTIDAMYIRLGSDATNKDQEFYGEIWKDNGGDLEKLMDTELTTITSANNNKMVKVNLTEPLEVYEGDVLLALACHYGGTNSVTFGMAQKAIDGTVVGMTSGGTADDAFSLSDPSVVMVRLNFDQTAGVKEETNLNSAINLYPNPTTGKTTIAYNLPASSEVKLQVMDITGKVIYTANEGTQNEGAHKVALDASTFTSGVYYVSITSNDTTVTKKLIKK